MNPVTALRNSLSFRLRFIITACLSMMAFAVGSTTSAAHRVQISPADEPREVIIKAKRALKTIKSMRWRMDCYCDDQHGRVVMERARAGRARTIEPDVERIFIGRDVYERKGNGPWEKWPDRNVGGPNAEVTSGLKAESATEDFSRFPEPDEANLRKQYKDAKFIGREILDNVPVLVYQYPTYYESSNKLFSTNKFWIGEQDGLPHKHESELEAEVSKHASPPCNKMKIVVTYYDFNAEIVIEPPPLSSIKTEPTEVTAAAAPQFLFIDEPHRQVVQQAAETWLKLIDAKKFSEGWEAASQTLKAKVSEALWEERQRYFADQMKGVAIKSRKLKKAVFVKSLSSASGQEGIVLEYERAIEPSGSISEQVELVLEPDQVWRIAIYQATTVEPEKHGGIGSGAGTGLGPGTGFNTGGVRRPESTNPNAPATSVDVRPIPLNSPMPRYTDAARKNKIQGTVRVRVLVGADGAVKQVRMVRGLPDGLEDEAIRAAYQLRFRPAMRDGQPVAFWVAVDVEFNLPDRK